jgi:hypothetical protein
VLASATYATKPVAHFISSETVNVLDNSHHTRVGGAHADMRFLILPSTSNKRTVSAALYRIS